MSQNYVRKFNAELSNTNINVIMSKLDYGVTDFNERLYIVGEICKDDFFIEYFDNYFKVSPTTKEELSLDNNICNSLERVADYLIFSDDGKESESSVMNYSKQIKVSKNEKSIEDLKYSDELEDVEPRKDLNYKKEIKQVITNSDLKRSEYLRELKKTRDDLSEVNKKHKQNLNTTNDDSKASFYISRKINGIIKSIDYSMVSYKDSMFGTIYFKRVMPDSTDMQDFMIDFKEISHIQALLECKPVPVLSNKWYSYASFALEEMINDTKHKMKKEDLEILEIARMCSDCTYIEILNEYGITKTHLKKSLKRIAKIINKHYLDICEDLWYLNMVKGTYKKCSDCGNIKLVQKFDKDKYSNDGYKNQCKECRK